MRINKFISDAGVCSRREADRLIRDGKVKINDTLASTGNQITSEDTVTINGERVSPSQAKIYIAFNKPYGVITTTDERRSNNVIDYVDVGARVYPIGRLDVHSTGLLLLTNDGSIVNKILKSKNKKEKEYLVTLNKPIQQKDLQKLRDGIILGDHKTLPARVKKMSAKKINIVLVQGINRQIRRMCEKLGYGVVELKRIRIGSIRLGDLSPGEWRNLTKREIDTLLK
ncbi:rRNA pseudouridine synthase [Patescibacteria group bacterium]|nr:rRNA pseudouridine synthase [Patescibacteria group bacterium]MBU2509152.1 rRNA pseudouridine synthase [Patescibacteria group bacterium]